MTFEEMRIAVMQARTTLRVADSQTQQMADLIAGKLRSGHVWSSTLRELKIELKKYNLHTGEWRE